MEPQHLAILVLVVALIAQTAVLRAVNQDIALAHRALLALCKEVRELRLRQR